MEIIDILNWINSQQINERLIQIQAALSTLDKNKEFPWLQLALAIPSFLTMLITIWVATKTAKTSKEVADAQAKASKETANLVADFNRELKEHEFRLAYMKEIIQRRAAAYDKLLDYIEKYFDDDFFPDGSFDLRFSSLEKVESFFAETQKMANNIDLLRYETVQIFMMTMFAGAFNLHTKAQELDELIDPDSEDSEDMKELSFHRELSEDISQLRKHMFNLRSKAHEDLLYLHDVDEYKREIELRRSNRQSSE
jgi:hypothetical protein